MKKALLCSLGISILSIVCIVLIGLSLLSGRFFPGTYIENVDVSLLKREEAQELFSQKRQDAYHLAIIDKNGNHEDLYGKDIQLRYDSDFSHIPKPDSFYLLFSLGKKQNYDLEGSLHYDEAALDAFITKYLEKHDSDEEARAAFLTAYIPGKGYAVGDEQWSGKIDRDKFRTMLIQAISEGSSRIDLREGDFYQKPEAKTEELKPVAEEKNKSLQALLRYNFSGETIELTPDRYHQWIENGEFNKKALKDYVKELKALTDTAGKERAFHTEDGRVLLLKGKYGFSLSVKKEEAALLTNLKSNEAVSREAEYDTVATGRGASDLGNTYVEVDIAKQKMFYVENGEIKLSSDCVTGNVSRNNGTPDGIYPLTYKTKNATLKGEDYETKVSYWMPFNRGIGFHDAWWRNRFGGNIYLRGGSHGCVNLPPQIAKDLYQFVYQGMPIICHH